MNNKSYTGQLLTAPDRSKNTQNIHSWFDYATQLSIVPSFFIGAHFYTPQYSLPARKSAPQSKMIHR